MLARFSLTGLVTWLVAQPALAHHPLGGALPETFAHGFLSGIGHPMIGFDHLAFVVAVGISAALIGLRWIGPAAFIGATLLGCMLLIGGVTLPAAEIIIAGSVAAIGYLILSGRTLGTTGTVALFALAGLFHGWAYGGAIVGAETGVLGAYLLGLGFIQYAVAIAAGLLATRFGAITSALDIRPRLAGAVVAGIGTTFLVEHIEALVFPGVM